MSDEPNDELDGLIKEFMDAAGIETPQPLGLSFDTNIRHWAREDLEDLIREFVRFIQEKQTDDQAEDQAD